MSWVKRNLYFLISSVVALVLLVISGIYLFSEWKLNGDSLKRLDAGYSELDRLTRQKPNPGNDKVDNIKNARQQEAQVHSIIAKERRYFSPIPPVPNPPNGVVTKEEFATALRQTIDKLQRAAMAASVILPKDYDFSFEAELGIPNLAAGSLHPLSVQLGDIKEICGVLFQAKVNSLDSLRRERVSTDDQKGPEANYLEPGSVTNQLAVVTPYEIAFHCFSTELAAVLSGFANNPHGFVVRAVNVEPGAAAAAAAAAAGPAAPGAPGFPGAVAPAPVQMTKNGMPILVDEKELRVTLAVDLIKLLPEK